MPCVAEFGIIDDWWNNLTQIKTYFHRYDRPAFALARWGVTLIPLNHWSHFTI